MWERGAIRVRRRIGEAAKKGGGGGGGGGGAELQRGGICQGPSRSFRGPRAGAPGVLRGRTSWKRQVPGTEEVSRADALSMMGNRTSLLKIIV